MLFDVNSPNFQQEERIWRKPFVNIAVIFFELLWSEHAVRITSSVYRNTETKFGSRKMRGMPQMSLPKH